MPCSCLALSVIPYNSVCCQRCLTASPSVADVRKPERSVEQRAGKKRSRWEASPEAESNALQNGMLDEGELPPAPSRSVTHPSGNTSAVKCSTKSFGQLFAYSIIVDHDTRHNWLRIIPHDGVCEHHVQQLKSVMHIQSSILCTSAHFNIVQTAEVQVSGCTFSP